MPTSKKPRRKYNIAAHHGRPLNGRVVGVSGVTYKLVPAPVRTPITSNQHFRNKIWPHNALRALAAGEGTMDDWDTLTYRIVSARFMAVLAYTEETVKELQKAEDAMLAAIVGWRVDGDLPSPERYALMAEALIAADTMQDEVDRELQVVAWKNTKKYVEALKETA